MVEHIEYPTWVERVLHPELEMASPSGNDYTKLKTWYHPDKEKSMRWVGNHLLRTQVCGLDYRTIYGHLYAYDMIRDCLGLLDGLRIIEQGIPVLDILNVDELMLWRSVVESNDGCIRVPYICKDEGGMHIYWDWRWPTASAMFEH